MPSLSPRRLTRIALVSVGLAGLLYGGAYYLALRGGAGWLAGLLALAGLLGPPLLLLSLVARPGQRAADELAMLALVASHSRTPVLISDAAGRTEWVNQAFTQLTGYTLDDLRGRLPGDLLRGPGTDPEAARAFNEALGAGAPASGELLNYRKDGSTFWVELSVTPVHDAAGRLTRYIAVQSDITERKAVERLRRELVATVTHELRTPLTAIRGALGLLAASQDADLSPRALALIEIAQGNTERLVRLVNDLLDTERMELGKMPFAPQPTPLVPLLAEAIAANEPFAAELGVRLALAPDPAQALVSADRDRLTQAITNLLSNAARFSPPGETVTVGVERSPGWARVAVADRGPGVPAEFRPHMFEKFAQASEQGGRGQGSGLGLSIARLIVEQHGGQIGFCDRPGGGSIFFVELPALDDGAPCRRRKASVGSA